MNLSFKHRGYLTISNLPKIDTFDYIDMEPLVNDFRLVLSFMRDFFKFETESGKNLSDMLVQTIDSLNVKSVSQLKNIHNDLISHTFSFYQPH